MRHSTDTVYTGLHCGRRPLSSTVIWDYGARKGWRASIIPASRDRCYNSNSQTSCALIVNEKYCRYRFYLYLTNNTATSSLLICNFTLNGIFSSHWLWHMLNVQQNHWFTPEGESQWRGRQEKGVSSKGTIVEKPWRTSDIIFINVTHIFQHACSLAAGTGQFLPRPFADSLFCVFSIQNSVPWSSSEEVKSIACFVPAVPLRVSVLRHDDQRDVHRGTHSSRSSRQSHLLHIQKWQISPNESTGCLSSKRSHAIKNKKQSVAYHLLLCQLREP